ncbi:MAG TPA: hypothetical protein VI544_00140 [Candidatus Nanoarchaeia archaeon]|nr:hypothetical protein [Candidatus Nanoarchaeia archaeon]
MDNKKVIVTLLILTIILSILTVAFTLTGSNKVFVERRPGTDQATVGLYVEGGAPISRGSSNDNSNVGLYVNN